MSEVAKRITNIVAAAVGNTMAPVVTSLLVLGAAVTGRPEWALMAIPGGAVAGGMSEEGIQLLVAALKDRARRTGRFAMTAAQDAGQPPEDLLERAMADERVRELLARTVDAASSSLGDWKIDALARAFVRGARDDAAVDEMLALVERIKQLEIADVRLLTAIYNNRIGVEGQQVPAGYARVGEILKADPGLAGALTLLVTKLEDLGLLEVNRSKAEDLDEIASDGSGLASSLADRRIVAMTTLGLRRACPEFHRTSVAAP